MTSLLPDLTPRPATLRVRTDDELLDAVPVMLGFHPRDSVVLVALHDGLVQVCARADIAPFLDQGGIDVFASLWGRVSADQAVALAYHDDPVVGRRALEALDRHVPWPCEFLRVPNDGAGGGGRSVVAAQAAYAGVRILPSREALGELFSPVGDAPGRSAALDSVLGRAPSDTFLEALALASRGLHEDVSLTPEQAATLAVALHSEVLVHAVVESMDASCAERARSLWIDVIRRVDARASAPAHLAVALASWVLGDGATLNLALERCEQPEDDPWFRFLEVVRDAALPPVIWPELRAGLCERWVAGEQPRP